MNKPSLTVLSGIISLSIQVTDSARAGELEIREIQGKPEVSIKERLLRESVHIEKREVTKSIECQRCSMGIGK